FGDRHRIRVGTGVIYTDNSVSVPELQRDRIRPLSEPSLRVPYKIAHCRKVTDGKDAAIPIRNGNTGEAGCRLDVDASSPSSSDQSPAGLQPVRSQGGRTESADCRGDEDSGRGSRLLWHAPPSTPAA